MTMSVDPPNVAWRYRCSLCGALLRPGAEITDHLEHHKAQPDWPGAMKLERVDEEPDP